MRKNVRVSRLGPFILSGFEGCRSAGYRARLLSAPNGRSLVFSSKRSDNTFFARRKRSAIGHGTLARLGNRQIPVFYVQSCQSPGVHKFVLTQCDGHLVGLFQAITRAEAFRHLPAVALIWTQFKNLDGFIDRARVIKPASDRRAVEPDCCQHFVKSRLPSVGSSAQFRKCRQQPLSYFRVHPVAVKSNCAGNSTDFREQFLDRHAGILHRLLRRTRTVDITLQSTPAPETFHSSARALHMRQAADQMLLPKKWLPEGGTKQRLIVFTEDPVKPRRLQYFDQLHGQDTSSRIGGNLCFHVGRVHHDGILLTDALFFQTVPPVMGGNCDPRVAQQLRRTVYVLFVGFRGTTPPSCISPAALPTTARERKKRLDQCGVNIFFLGQSLQPVEFLFALGLQYPKFAALIANSFQELVSLQVVDHDAIKSIKQTVL